MLAITTAGANTSAATPRASAPSTEPTAAMNTEPFQRTDPCTTLVNVGPGTRRSSGRKASASAPMVVKPPATAMTKGAAAMPANSARAMLVKMSAGKNAQ